MTKQEREQQNQRITELMAKHGRSKVAMRQAIELEQLEIAQQLKDVMMRTNGQIVHILIDEAKKS